VTITPSCICNSTKWRRLPISTVTSSGPLGPRWPTDGLIDRFEVYWTVDWQWALTGWMHWVDGLEESNLLFCVWRKYCDALDEAEPAELTDSDSIRDDVPNELTECERLRLELELAVLLDWDSYWVELEAENLEPWRTTEVTDRMWTARSTVEVEWFELPQATGRTTWTNLPPVWRNYSDVLLDEAQAEQPDLPVTQWGGVTSSEWKDWTKQFN
jgi:hypothetical protein